MVGRETCTGGRNVGRGEKRVLVQGTLVGERNVNLVEEALVRWRIVDWMNER